ncbi:MAG: sigma 54-interacting transcriptional regulator [Bdellovibrionaceae bacterium]|nr:sigma 54-interacting transcriptional regulator [Pseudobdellovibrionaceae bacterium]
MRYILGILFLLSTLGISKLSFAIESELDKPSDLKIETSDCEKTLEGLSLLWGGKEGEVAGGKKSDKLFTAVLEEHKLSELPELALKHPSIMMTAAQRIYSIILKAGSYKMNLRGKGEVTIYKLFSEPTEYNKGKFIVGHEKELETFVDSIRSAIRGSVKVPFFEGPAGTGKTLLQDILRHALYHSTLYDEEAFYYTVEWVNLDQIPSLDFINNGTARAPLHDSPFAILPESSQARLLSHVQAKVDVSKIGPLNPVSSPDGHNSQIRKEIVKFYAKQKAEKGKGKEKSSVLSDQEIIQALDKHLVIKRQILGMDGSAPILDAQGKEYNPGALFIKENLLLASIVEGSTDNPLAWTYGLIPKANGSVLFLDEFPRNISQLRDMFLRLFESKSVQYGGSPVVPVDTFIIAAGNHESLEKLYQEGGAKAHMDRITAIPFNWSIRPHEIAMTQLLMYKEVYSRKLDDKNAKIKKANLLELFPRASVGEDFLSPDGREELWIGDGDSRVHISPHALMFAAMITSATRLHIDGAEALTKENHYTYRGNTYKSPIERLKYLMGKDSHLSTGEIEDLEKASILFKEGHFGLSMRDATEWITRAASKAAKTTKDLTPKIVIETFRELLAEGVFKSLGGDEKLRKRWLIYADLIANYLLLDQLRADVMRSLGNHKTLIENTYDEVILEMMAAGKGSEDYKHPRTQTAKPINKDRLKKVSLIYQELFGENLDFQQMATMFMVAEASRSDKGVVQRDRQLLDAITKYFAEKAAADIDLASIIQVHQTGESPDRRTRGRYDDLVLNMKRLGYTEEGMVNTLIYVEELETRVAKARASANAPKN